MVLARTDRRLIQACEVHLLQFGMHQGADSSSGLAAPVEYRRLVPRDGNDNRRARQRRKMGVLRRFQWQALERTAARRVVVGLVLLEQRWRQLEFAGGHRPERAQETSGTRPELSARRRLVEVIRIVNFIDDGGQMALAIHAGAA